MGESKHTPGEWATRPSRTTDDIGIMADGGCVAEVFSEIRSKGENARGEQLANARLIAAAPELLAMLKVAQLWLDVDGRFDMQGINAAIAKAEGQS